jgi:exonuclease VII large subunit
MEQQILRFDERRVLRISELVGELRGQLEPHFRDVWIQGEISNLRRPGSGHLYFTLKDDEAQISAVCSGCAADTSSSSRKTGWMSSSADR